MIIGKIRNYLFGDKQFPSIISPFQGLVGKRILLFYNSITALWFFKPEGLKMIIEYGKGKTKNREVVALFFSRTEVRCFLNKRRLKELKTILMYVKKLPFLG